MSSYSWAQARRSILGEVPALTSERLDQVYADACAFYGERTHALFQKMTLLQHAIEATVLLLEFCPDPDAIIASILQHALVVDPANSGRVQRSYGSEIGRAHV